MCIKDAYVVCPMYTRLGTVVPQRTKETKALSLGLVREADINQNKNKGCGQTGRRQGSGKMWFSVRQLGTAGTVTKVPRDPSFHHGDYLRAMRVPSTQPLTAPGRPVGGRKAFRGAWAGWGEVGGAQR